MQENNTVTSFRHEKEVIPKLENHKLKITQGSSLHKDTLHKSGGQAEKNQWEEQSGVNDNMLAFMLFS